MDELKAHFERSARESLRPDFTGRVIASVQAREVAASGFLRSPCFAVAVVLALATADVLAFDRLPRSTELPRDEAWTQLYQASIHLKRHL